DPRHTNRVQPNGAATRLMSETDAREGDPMTVRRPLAALTLAATALAGLTACGRETPAEFDSGPAPAATTAPAADKDAASREDKPRPAQDASPTPVDTTPVGPEDALHTITHDLPGADERAEATVTVGLHSLRQEGEDRKSTRLNSSHVKTSYAVFCLKQNNRLRPIFT